MDDLTADVIAGMQASLEADELDRAIGWTVEATDLEFPGEPSANVLLGFFHNVGDAMGYANEYAQELEREFPEGWRVQVRAVMPADRAGHVSNIERTFNPLAVPAVPWGVSLLFPAVVVGFLSGIALVGLERLL